MGKNETDESHFASSHCTRLHVSAAHDPEPHSQIATQNYRRHDIHIYLQYFKYTLDILQKLTFGFMSHPRQNMGDK